MGGKRTEVEQADGAGIARAAQVIRDGGLVAVPTETVYGLAARSDSAEAVAGIYRAKGRPDFNPLIVHVSDIAAAQALVEWPEAAAGMASAHWPGALTMVLPLREGAHITPAVTAGLPTLAVRCPAHPAMRALLAETGLPLAAPSANRSNAISPTSAAHVLATLDGRIDLVLDGGPSQQGLESTILAWRGGEKWELLRPGPVDIAGAQRVSAAKGIEAPGQLSRHYSPGKSVRLDARESGTDEFMIGFGGIAGQCTLSETGDLFEAAARLYACLHEAAASDMLRIAVAPIPGTGVGRAINDRLRRAAA